MTQPSLLDALDDAATFTAAVARYFRERPGVWVRATDLERVGGRQAWRTRVSEARRQYQMRIENRCRSVVKADGRAWKLSEYRWVP